MFVVVFLVKYEVILLIEIEFGGKMKKSEIIILESEKCLVVLDV